MRGKTGDRSWQVREGGVGELAVGAGMSFCGSKSASRGQGQFGGGFLDEGEAICSWRLERGGRVREKKSS